jgi:bis(5'-nucleosyl)-tetraphosphatase (symmetrical)
MARYVIGDVQGCFTQLQQLLQLIDFRSDCDQLWFCGDLIARGPESLATLRWLRAQEANVIAVLGNHDLNFLASLFGYGKISKADQLDALVQADDRWQLADWLLQLPLIYQPPTEPLLLVHAGIAPHWTITEATHAAAAACDAMQQQPSEFFRLMYGNQPVRWLDAATTTEQHRFTVNSCTRMRYCFADGSLELQEKGEISVNPDLVPWFQFWHNRPHPQILFGHWAALNGNCPVQGIEALDTGCVWGNSLTAYCIESEQRYSVAGYQKQL